MSYDHGGAFVKPSSPNNLAAAGAGNVAAARKAAEERRRREAILKAREKKLADDKRALEKKGAASVNVNAAARGRKLNRSQAVAIFRGQDTEAIKQNTDKRKKSRKRARDARYSKGAVTLFKDELGIA